MKLHANARTCPKSRRLLVKRIEEEGWSLMVAAEAAGISEPTARKWLCRWRQKGRRACWTAPQRRGGSLTRRPRAHRARSSALRRLRMTAAEIAEVLGMALSTVSLWLTRRARQALPPGAARAAQPLRAEAAGRAHPRRHQEAGALRHGRQPRSGTGTGSRAAEPAGSTPRLRR